MTLTDLRATQREAILNIAHCHVVTRVRVFGSLVRNEANPNSDLNLLINAGNATPPFFPGGLIADLQAALGRKVDVVEEGGLPQLLKARICSEAVTL